MATCPTCEGVGKLMDEHGKMVDCPDCGGSGMVEEPVKTLGELTPRDGPTLV